MLGFSPELNAVPSKEVELIKTYRQIAITADMDRALNEIRNEIFTFDEPNKRAIDLEFNTTNTHSNLSLNLQKLIHNEFLYVYNLLDFQRKGLDYFNRWYIDGKIFIHKIIDKNKPKTGIQKLVIIDPLKIKKIIEYPQPNTDGVYDLSKVKTYYIFSDVHDVHASKKMSRTMIIHKDTVAYSDSGIYETTGVEMLTLSNLWKTIVPYNNMKMMEEALMVYRVVRSPERRVFYINVGNLSKPKAEQYMQELMNKFKNKLVYNSLNGTIVDRKNVLSMVEDYWLPRRDDGKGTEVQSLPGASNLGSIDDVDLFKKKFLDATNVPSTRFNPENNVIFGRTTEISRDEYRFKKFLDRLRNRFIIVFEDLLYTQLILKNIITDCDWDDIKKTFQWIYAEDNNLIQWKENEVLNSQVETLTASDALIGKYYDRAWIMHKVLKLSEEEIQELIAKAEKDGAKILKMQMAAQGMPAEDIPSADTGTAPLPTNDDKMTSNDVQGTSAYDKMSSNETSSTGEKDKSGDYSATRNSVPNTRT